MIDRTPEWVAHATGGRLIGRANGDGAARADAPAARPDEEPPARSGPRRAVIDSREVGEGDLFAGLRGERSDGGEFAEQALEAGAWGVVVAPAHAERAAKRHPTGAIVAVDDPLAALQALARAWRRELGCVCVGITGSTGKTSTKDILGALLGRRLRTHTNRENLNTEIGLPLALLEAPRGTEALVLEMAMRGEHQISELVAIAEPQVGVIVNVGPVHLELLGTIERVAAAKSELIRDLDPGSACIVPAGEPLLEPHLRDDIDTITFGPGGDVHLVGFSDGVADIVARGERIQLELSFSEPHNLRNTLAAVAVAGVLGVRPDRKLDVTFSSMRGEVVELGGGVTVVNDCYNANPMSMTAALEHLAGTPSQRRIAVLGVMAELGDESERFHREIGERADELGIDVLVTVGEEALAFAGGFRGETYSVATPEEAGALLEELVLPGDRVLVKGSRSAGLERVLAG